LFGLVYFMTFSNLNDNSGVAISTNKFGG